MTKSASAFRTRTAKHRAGSRKNKKHRNVPSFPSDDSPQTVLRCFYADPRVETHDRTFI